MKVLITGGCGFIGYTTSNYLLNKGYEVIAFDNLSRDGVEHNLRFLIRNKNFTWIKGDVSDSNELSKLKDFDIDFIIHLAANPGVPKSFLSPYYDFYTNALGTLNMLEFSRIHRKIPIIIASTNKVYSQKELEKLVQEKETRYVLQNFGISENFSIDGNSHSPYGCSKVSADLYVQEYFSAYNIPTIVNRLSCIYGPHQFGKEEQGWLAWFLIAKIKNLPITIYGNGKQTRDCLFGEDLAELFELQIKNIDLFKGEVFNIGGGVTNTTSLIELIKEIDERFSFGSFKKYENLRYNFEDWRPADQKAYYTDLTKISEFWIPKTNLVEGIEKTFNWIENYQKYIEPRNVENINSNY